MLSWENAESLFHRRVFNFLTDLLPAEVAGSHRLVKPYLWFARHCLQEQKRGPLYKFLEGLGIGREKVRLIEHHRAHAVTCLHGAPERFREGPLLVITVDGTGDGLSGTVSESREGGLARLRSWTTYHSLGELYGRVTIHLGMKPNEHEYKVMGLAPYAPEELAERGYRIFKNYVGLSADGLSLQVLCGKWGTGLSRKIRKDFGGLRFDAVVSGLQRRTEEVILSLVRNWIGKTGIRKIAVAGGVFMNIKVNMLLAELPEVGDLFVFPSCGDESIPSGAAYAAYAEERRRDPALPPPQSIRDVYWGPGYSEGEIEAALRHFSDRISVEPCGDIEARIVDLLKEGNVVARFAGRMEWGARSLGNRSLLADPRDLRIVRKLNDAIKQRDFWMPFAPSILRERQSDYIENSKGLSSPHMMVGFRSKPAAERDLLAALHPKDLTCRPQIVEWEANPRYHCLLSRWEEETGCGGVLNTSFTSTGSRLSARPRTRSTRCSARGWTSSRWRTVWWGEKSEHDLAGRRMVMMNRWSV